MHRDIKQSYSFLFLFQFKSLPSSISLYYNSIDSNKSYFPQSGEFCIAKSPTASNWYRARIIRLVGKHLLE
jgi:hypothetical protein